MYKLHNKVGRGGGLVVSVLAFYSDDPSSNPAGYLNFLCEKTRINKKEAGVDPSLKNNSTTRWAYTFPKILQQTHNIPTCVILLPGDFLPHSDLHLFDRSL